MVLHNICCNLFEVVLHNFCCGSTIYFVVLQFTLPWFCNLFAVVLQFYLLWFCNLFASVVLQFYLLLQSAYGCGCGSIILLICCGSAICLFAVVLQSAIYLFANLLSAICWDYLCVLFLETSLMSAIECFGVRSKRYSVL